MAKKKVSDDKQLLEALAATNEAAGVYKRHVAFKTVTLVLLGVCVLLLTAMMSLDLASTEGLFTVNLIKPSPEVRMSLYSSKELNDPTSRLEFEPHGKLDNIAEYDLPDNLDDFDGDHSGKNYLCYTFYLKNVGEGIIDVTAQILVSQVVKGADEAIRIKLYEDGEPGVYAKKAKNGEPEPNSICWVSDDVAYKKVVTLNPEDVKKYTIVVWLEGPDPECINDIFGGFVRLDMAFEGTSK